MRKVFDFGKIDFYGTGRRINAVSVEVELRNDDEKPVFSACANVWNLKHTDIVAGGQCLDYLVKYFKHNKLYMTIYELWQKYHLNNLHAGTQEQEKALENFNNSDYDARCKYLESIGLYEVEHEGQPYKYGHGWIYYPIPENDLNKIKELLK